MRTENEIQRKLTLRGYHPDVIQQTLGKLYKEKLLDDKHYAEVYLNNLKEYRSFGYYGIKKKLLEKHLSQAIIEQLMEQEVTADEELNIGKKFLQKELGPGKKTLDQVQKQKLARKLQARGFRNDIIAKLVF